MDRRNQDTGRARDGRMPRARQPGFRPGRLPRQSHQGDHSARPRRRHRRHGARARQGFRAAQSVRLRRREPRRRQHHHRRQCLQGRAAGRLYAVPAVAQQRLDQSVGLQDSVLRPGEGFRADHQSRLRQPGADHEPQGSGQQLAGAGRLFEGASGQAQFRLVRARRRFAPHRRMDEARQRRQDHPHSLQGRLRCVAGVHRGRHPAALSHRRQSRSAAADQRGRDQGPAGARQDAQPDHSECADVRRIRIAVGPDRLRDLVRHVRAEGHAGADHQQAERRLHRDREDAGIRQSNT